MSFGVLYTCYNDAEDIVKSYKSLLQTIPPDTSFKLVVTDAGSTEDQLQLIRSELGTEPFGPYPNLTDALNAGFYRLMGYEESNIKNINEGGSRVDHVLWLHADQRFFQYDWVGKLIKIYDHMWPMVAKLGPGTSNIDPSIPELQKDIALRHGNQCPWVMSTEFLKGQINRHGYIFNPEYKNIGGAEDIHLWQELHNDGYLQLICGLVDVWHEGAGTRFLRDTSADQMKNREIYHKYWSNGIFNNQLGPTITFDLDEVNKDIMTNFGYLRDEVINNISIRDEITKIYFSEAKRANPR